MKTLNSDQLDFKVLTKAGRVATINAVIKRMLQINEVSDEDLVTYAGFDLLTDPYYAEPTEMDFVSAYLNAYSRFCTVPEAQKPRFESWKEVGNYPKDAATLMRAFSRFIFHYPEHPVKVMDSIVKDLQEHQSISSATSLFYQLTDGKGFPTGCPS